MIGIKERREALGISQAEAARRGNLNAASWCAIEGGRLRPYAPQLEKIAFVLGVSVDELREETEVPQ